MCTRKWKSNWISWKNRKSKRSLRSNIRLHYFPWYHVHLNAAMPFSNIEVSSKNADNASFVLVLRSLFLFSRSTPLLHPTGYKLFIMKNPRLVTARHYVWSISLWIPSLQLNALWTVFSFYWIFFFLSLVRPARFSTILAGLSISIMRSWVELCKQIIKTVFPLSLHDG